MLLIVFGLMCILMMRERKETDEQSSSVQFLMYCAYFVIMLLVFWFFSVGYLNSSGSIDDMSNYLNRVKKDRVVLPFSTYD